MLTTPEAAAHITIIDTIERVLDDEIGSRAALHIMWRSLESFAPRCNCRRVMSFGPWRNGSRMVACACGVGYWESRITHCVPLVELVAHARR